MDYKDYYKSLGVAKTASQTEIKKAFRKLARESHPDLKPGDKAAERRFKDINEANEVLSDPAKRKQYDTLGADWESYARAGATGGAGASGDPFGGAGFGGQGGNVRYEFRSSGDAGGFSDFFRTFFGGGAAGATGSAGSSRATDTAARRAAGRGGSATGSSFEEILSDMGFDATGVAADPNGRAGGGTRRRPAGSVEAVAEISLDEAFHGTSRLVEIEGKRLEVTVPRGVDTGSRIRVTGRGGDGRDLHVVIKLQPHAVFTRKGADLERELAVTLADALLGAEVPVTTLRGKVLLKIPAGTQAGRVFRLTGQGMPRLKGEGSGDLYARIKVVLPTALSSDATAKARELFDLIDQPDPRAGT